jgi:hypothetical protein
VVVTTTDLAVADSKIPEADTEVDGVDMTTHVVDMEAAVDSTRLHRLSTLRTCLQAPSYRLDSHRLLRV